MDGLWLLALPHYLRLRGSKESLVSCSPISDAAAIRAVAMKNVHIAEEAPAEMEARIKAGPLFFWPATLFF